MEWKLFDYSMTTLVSYIDIRYDVLAIFLDKFLEHSSICTSFSSFSSLFTVRFTFISGSKRGSGTFHFFDKVLGIYKYCQKTR